MIRLKERLKALQESSYYPWHMPGHKRSFSGFHDPYSLDITEITDFDDLHHPEGILKESMEHAAGIYGAIKTYYLVNGSTCGILAAISAVAKDGGKIIMARNCHKSAYHALQLNRLSLVSIYPKAMEEGCYGEISVETVKEAIHEHPDAVAVMLVSPSYEGVVSDIRAIAKLCHEKGMPLIVDEAHGAHFPFGKEAGYPASAVNLGADLVIQSVHKTLPSLTQTALLHVGEDACVDPLKLSFYLSVYQSSSPSYLFLSSIEESILFMDSEEGRKKLSESAAITKAFRNRVETEIRHIRLFKGEGIYDFGKLVLVPAYKRLEDGTLTDGSFLSDILRNRYFMEPEMHTERYVILMTSVMDEKEAFDRLFMALKEIDLLMDRGRDEMDLYLSLPVEAPKVRAGIQRAFSVGQEEKMLEQACGQVCGAYIYIYPPGIPLLTPGEEIGQREITMIKNWKAHGLEVHGMRDDFIPIAKTNELC